MIASIEELVAIQAQKAQPGNIGGEATLLFSSRVLAPLLSYKLGIDAKGHETWLESAAELLGEPRRGDS